MQLRTHLRKQSTGCRLGEPMCTLYSMPRNREALIRLFRLSENRAAAVTPLDAIFPGFQINDYLFQPCGYSLNAIRGSENYTIHVTPEEVGS